MSERDYSNQHVNLARMHLEQLDPNFLRDDSMVQQSDREPTRVSVRFGVYQVRSADPTAVCYEPTIIIRPENLSVGQFSRVDSMVKLEAGEGMTIGRYVHIASYSHVGIGGGETIIGDFCAISSGGKVISGSNQLDMPSMSAVAPKNLQRIEKTRTIMEPYSVVLSGAIVLPGVVLHEGAILAAGGVATHDIPAWEVWAGVPARFLKRRPKLAPIGERR